MKKRNVIIHYHLFKNAGSSIDKILKDSFGELWRNYDMSNPGQVIVPNTLTALIENLPEIKAWSSHQIVPPLPEVNSVNILPIIFVRHPIDRAKSAYLFEWKKQKNTPEPVGAFELYIKEKFLSERKNAIEDFQTLRLANIFSNSYFNHKQFSDDEILERAKSFIASLQCVGLVDQFNKSMQAYREMISPFFPEMKFKSEKVNVLQPEHLTLDEKLEMIKEELSLSSYKELLNRNAMDLELYRFVKESFYGG